MKETQQPVKYRLPVFSLLAFAAPFIGGTIGLISRLGAAPDAFGDFLIFLGFGFFGLVAGLLLAVIGLFRHERPRLLPWCVLIVELIPALYTVIRFK
jgi:hypothetical protein